jgi:glycosyltransferase involved in cell wall biosynthesis
MRIAQVAPLYESVPPRGYGGTERVVSYLTEELVKRGHDVTLFASGDSVTRARLESILDKALRLGGDCFDPIIPHMQMFGKAARMADAFDIIHFHTDYLHFPLARRLPTPHITTLHGRLNIPDLIPLYLEFTDIPVVSISDHQRQPLPFADWRGTVYNGIPEELFAFHNQRGSYLVFLGRISPEKGVEDAIRIAERAGMRIRVSGKVDKVDEDYFRERIKPMLKLPFVEFIGELGQAEKDELIGNAYATLFPIAWPEPFGLVMIESMACGTPVIAYRRGSVPEVMQDGVTGFIVDNLGEAVNAVDRIDSLNRYGVRRYFEDRFSAARMTNDYLAVYQGLTSPMTPPRWIA